LLLTFGGMGLLPQGRGGTSFCPRCAVQCYDVITQLSRWQKPWHQQGVPRRCLGRPVPRWCWILKFVLYHILLKNDWLPVFTNLTSRGTEGNGLYRPVRDCSGSYCCRFTDVNGWEKTNKRNFNL